MVFRDKYREIGNLMGECNREINQIRVKVHREFPKRSVKQTLDALIGMLWACFACQKAFSCALRRGSTALPGPAAFGGIDPARPWASSCQLRSRVSPVPESEGSFDFAQDGHPRCGFWGVETEATRPPNDRY